jgi:hypothetical protein
LLIKKGFLVDGVSAEWYYMYVPDVCHCMDAPMLLTKFGIGIAIKEWITRYIIVALALVRL